MGKKVVYQITRAECKKEIKKGFVCGGCGGQLEPIETINNSGERTYWAGCLQCNHYTHGIETIYFKIARKLVENGHIVPLQHMYKCEYEDTAEKLAYFFAMQTEALSYQIKKIDKALSDYRSDKLIDLVSELAYVGREK